MADTIFDKILRKEIPSTAVYEDDEVYAFRDVNPQAPTHVLVIPKKKVERFAHLRDKPAPEVGAFFVAVARVASELKLDGPGYRIVINNGRDGQQSVEYFHAHILGGRALTWPPG